MTKIPACFPARSAVISLRKKGKDYLPAYFKVVFPEDWTKKQLLDYVRSVHVGESARIVKWNESRSVKDSPLMWLANPRAFQNFKKGEMK